MSVQSSYVQTITNRFSCRTYSGQPIEEDARRDLAEAAEEVRTGPFGSRLRFVLVAAAAEDGDALKGLGTYGTIRGATAFILGAAQAHGMYREDFGYEMEKLILRATALGLGTCWLGGFFTRGSFSRRIGVARGERIPAVTAVGQIPALKNVRDGIMRRGVGGSRRKDWWELFRDGNFETALTREAAGEYASALEMARWAPSASNRQPVRIVRAGSSWHFFIKRTPGYPPGVARALMGIEDLQRVDSGISKAC
jgi:nitroreductase